MLLSSQVIDSALTPWASIERLYIAYSGGVDSHVLLHLCAADKQLRDKITAVHVHHGLQAQAEAWTEHCRSVTQDLGVEFILLRVNAAANKGESPEEAARNARYSALKALLDAGDILLVAQHLEDQLETVLLQLLRGSGLRGLSGMPERMPLGRGLMLRPLLNVSKQAIDDYAKAHRLQWVDDPTNALSDYDRNYLRNAVVPLLKQRWPACDVTVARAARHCAEAQALVSEVAGELYARICNESDKTLSISRLHACDRSRQQLVIRHWLQDLGLKMPAEAFVLRVVTQLAAAGGNRDPVLMGPGLCLRRYRDKLYCLERGRTETLQEVSWPEELPSITIGGNIILSALPSAAGIGLERWRQGRITVKFRRGGEKIPLPGRKGRHTLKNLYQEAGIPPWEREAMPLVYLDGKLAAVGDRWISAEFYIEGNEGCIRFSLQKR